MSETSKSHLQRQLVIISIAILAFLFGLWFHHNTQANAVSEKLSATELSQARVITPFFLTDDKNRPFTLENLKGHWSLLFFGFTNCPDLCPTTLASLHQSYQKLATLGQNPLPQIVFISVDPERDNPQRINSYLRNFNPNFIGATGSEEYLNGLTKEVSVIYAKVAGKELADNEDYSIDHSGAVIIVNPRGQFFGIFSAPLNADHIAQDMRAIMREHS